MFLWQEESSLQKFLYTCLKIRHVRVRGNAHGNGHIKFCPLVGVTEKAPCNTYSHLFPVREAFNTTRYLCVCVWGGGGGGGGVLRLKDDTCCPVLFWGFLLLLFFSGTEGDPKNQISHKTVSEIFSSP